MAGPDDLGAAPVYGRRRSPDTGRLDAAATKLGMGSWFHEERAARGGTKHKSLYPTDSEKHENAILRLASHRVDQRERARNQIREQTLTIAVAASRAAGVQPHPDTPA